MASGELNKYAGAILGSLTLMMGLNFLSQGLVSPKPPAKPGWDLPAAEAGGGGAQAAAPVAAEPIAVRLAKADVQKGQAASRQCMSCHKFEKGGANTQGPALWGIVNHDSGKAAGFAYSPAMAALGKKWDYELLDTFLANPKAAVPGTKMTFAGVSRPEMRADLIAYLNSLSDSPAPLPK